MEFPFWEASNTKLDAAHSGCPWLSRVLDKVASGAPF